MLQFLIFTSAAYGVWITGKMSCAALGLEKMSGHLVLLLAMWLGCIWLRAMIFLTLQRNWKILRRMWKPRRSLLMTSPERAMFPRSTLCVYQECNLPFGQQRSSRGLAWEVPPLLVS